MPLDNQCIVQLMIEYDVAEQICDFLHCASSADSECALNSSPFSFWKEAHRTNARKGYVNSNCNINGCNNITDIANGFKTEYEQIFHPDFPSNDLNAFHNNLNNV